MRPRDRLLQRGIPNTSIRKVLEDWSDRLSIWERIWTAVVVAGLGIEIFVALSHFLPHDIFDLIWPHSTVLADIASTMVFGGVFGELIVSSKAGQVETDLREENDFIIGGLYERVAQAERATADANLARAKLEMRLHRRTVERALSAEEERALITRLQQYSGQEFGITLAQGTQVRTPSTLRIHEMFSFVEQLRKALLNAGWQERIIDKVPESPVHEAVTVYVHGGEHVGATRELIAALTDLDIACVEMPVLGDLSISPLITVGPL